MVPQPRRRGTRRLAACLALLTAAAVFPLVSACDKVPLLAPSGSVITLFPSANFVASNGEIEIVATVIEQGTAPSAPSTPGSPGAPPTTTSTTGAGTPVHNGTVVTFTTNLGRVEPREARTNNGQVRVKFFADGQSGQATITAFSGGASGKIENLPVGSAAIERILLFATPQTLPPTGGVATVQARAETAQGVALPGLMVAFSTDNGVLSSSTAVTDNSGTATTTLTTSTTAKVTANVSGKTAEVTVNLRPRTGVTLAAPTTPVSAGVPATFTVGVSATANVRDVIIDFGDGESRSLGAITQPTPIQHTYLEAGTFPVRATAIEATGFTETVGTVITILPAQPPTVTITAPENAPVNTSVVVSANVTGATSTVVRYEWTFGTDAIPQTLSTASRQVSVRWTSPGPKVISVRVIQASGPEGDAVKSINITP
jgi:hypothetical protein